jgi:hypothetical protein
MSNTDQIDKIIRLRIEEFGFKDWKEELAKEALAVVYKAKEEGVNDETYCIIPYDMGLLKALAKDLGDGFYFNHLSR